MFKGKALEFLMKQQEEDGTAAWNALVQKYEKKSESQITKLQADLFGMSERRPDGVLGTKYLQEVEDVLFQLRDGEVDVPLEQVLRIVKRGLPQKISTNFNFVENFWDQTILHLSQSKLLYRNLTKKKSMPHPKKKMKCIGALKKGFKNRRTVIKIVVATIVAKRDILKLNALATNQNVFHVEIWPHFHKM